LVKVNEYTGSSSPYQWYATTSYDYTELNQLNHIYHLPIPATTTFSYFKLGGKQSQTDPNSQGTGLWSYGYYDNGQLASQTDPRGVTISSSYDLLGRIATKSYACTTSADCCNALALVNGLCPSAQMAPTITYTYDLKPTDGQFNGLGNNMCPNGGDCQNVGRLTYVNDWSGQHLYAYDARGRQAMSRDIVASVPYNTSHLYDSMDRQTSLTYPDGEVVGYTYDDSGSALPIGMTSNINGTMVSSAPGKVQYNQANEPTTITIGDPNNYAYLSFGYQDPALRLTSWNGDTFNGATLTYDYAGNVNTESLYLPNSQGIYVQKN
jgi:YD repeat-containing protein